MHRNEYITDFSEHQTDRALVIECRVLHQATGEEVVGRADCLDTSQAGKRLVRAKLEKQLRERLKAQMLQSLRKRFSKR